MLVLTGWLFVFCLINLPSRIPETPYQKVFNQTNESIIAIVVTSEDRQHSCLGTGCFINNKGLILTCGHLFNRKNSQAFPIKVILRTPGNNRFYCPAKLLSVDFDKDLALIQVHYIKATPYLRFASQEAVGQEVIVIGHPLGLGWTMTHGIVSSLRRKAPPLNDQIQIDAAVNHGNSGGPVLDVNGDILGVAVSIYGDIDAFTGNAFAVDLISIREFLNKNKRLLK